MYGVLVIIFISFRVTHSEATQKDILMNIKTNSHRICFPKKYLFNQKLNNLSWFVCKDIDKRMSASEALKHPWINGNADLMLI